MAETLARLFRHAVSYDKSNALLTKRDGAYQPISSRELYRRVGRLHLGLKQVGVGRGDRCGLLSENRWEWAVADFAMMTAGIVSVPLYPTLPPDQLHYMLEHSECRVAMVSTPTQLSKIEDVWPQLPFLQGVVVFDPVGLEDERVISLSRLITDEPLSEVESAEFEESISTVVPEDPASIVYTSGTTGTPKGVVLSHGNFGTNVRDSLIQMRPSDTCLSFLPLSHVAERTADYAFFWGGATIAYPESLETVPQDMQQVRPTVALAVPRFFEKIHGRVLAAIATAPPLRRKLFEWAIRTGLQASELSVNHKPLPAGLRLKRALADFLVFRKLRARLGGRFRFFVSGAAPLAKHLAEFFYAVGIPICEAYGLTETSPLISMNALDDIAFGTVGRLIPNVEVKIADDGEILVRGPNVMQGYYKAEELTAQVIVDGWFHTGDIGQIERGRLTITDRKKDLLKTSGGKYIAPAPLENQLKTSAYISMAVVVAEQRNFPSAIIVPDFEKLRVWARDNNAAYRDNTELTAHPKVQALLQAETDLACADLAKYEKVKKIHVLDRELTIEDGEITPTMKVRRRAVEMRFARQIDAMYA